MFDQNKSKTQKETSRHHTNNAHTQSHAFRSDIEDSATRFKAQSFVVEWTYESTQLFQCYNLI